ncbi:hypothetical protein VTK26DRAFT_8803 [Humicola hyalothermophila]
MPRPVRRRFEILVQLAERLAPYDKFCARLDRGVEVAKLDVVVCIKKDIGRPKIAVDKIKEFEPSDGTG